MSVQIVTGYTGEPHITPKMDATVNRGIFGEDGCILSSGSQMSASMPDINTFVIADGAFSIQGHIGITNGETLTVDTCASGSRRIDLVVARFEHDSNTNFDTLSIVLLKGTETTSQYPTTPIHRTGTIADGANADLPLYKITLDGSTVTFAKTVDTASASLDDISNPVSGMWKDARDNAGIKIEDKGSSSGWAPAIDMKSANYDFSAGVYKDKFYVSAVSNSNYNNNTNSNVSVAFDPSEKVIDIGGMKVGANQVLWTGGYLMMASHKANLSQRVSAQASGIVLVFSAYSNGQVQDYNWVTHYVPKWMVSAHSGAGVCVFCCTVGFGRVGCKYLYISDSQISGQADNASTGTASGITYNNGYWVLRAVIGV